MRLAGTQPLFAWESLEDSPSIATLRDFLATLPEGQLLDRLRQARGKGRDDYPVSTLWGVVVLTIALRHATCEACLSERTRNAELRRLIGIASETQVPKKGNVSRFLDVLGREPHPPLLREVFAALVRRLGLVVPDLGQHTAGDATSLNARRKPAGARAAEEAAGLPPAAGGRQEYKDETGQVVKVVEWCGSKPHLLVDVKHEVALAYRVSASSVGDNEVLPDLVQQARGNLPAEWIKTLAYDKAADDGDVHELLHDAGIEPVIHNRAMWKEELERPLPGRFPLHVVHDEAGTLYCYDTASEPPVRHPMAYIETSR